MKTVDYSQPLGKPRVVVTGCAGLIGQEVIRELHSEFDVIGLDIEPVQDEALDVDWIQCDLTDQENVRQALNQVRERHGSHLASIVHLAAHYDFSGEESPLYRELTVEGTRRLLRELQSFDVEQFIFSSTLLLMKPVEEGQLTETSRTQAEWDYPKSKLVTERLIETERGGIPSVILRIAGVYDEQCHSLPIAQQISRIYEKQMESYLFPGDTTHGQSFVHLSDLVACIRLAIEKRRDLSHYELLLVGEEDVVSYEELQDELGKLIHGKEWPTVRIPKAAAKAGAWVKDKIATDEEGKPFIKPWMIELADQNYPISNEQARKLLGWEPRHRLRDTLPLMIEQLRQDPERWYETNKLPTPERVQAKAAAGAENE